MIWEAKSTVYEDDLAVMKLDRGESIKAAIDRVMDKLIHSSPGRVDWSSLIITTRAHKETPLASARIEVTGSVDLA